MLPERPLKILYTHFSFGMERSAQIKTYGDLIQRYRDEHAVEWLTSAAMMMQETGDLQQVLQSYLHLDTLST